MSTSRLAMLAAATMLSVPAGAGEIAADCTFNGKPLYGDVQFVTSFPDVRIQVVDSFPDLKVKMVESFPDACGKWQAVTAFPDVRVQIVDAFPDVKIQYVESFPGLP